MSAIVPLTAGSKLPAYLAKREILAAINADVVTGASFSVLSIKGKVFTLVKGAEHKVLTRADDPDEAVQFINLTAVRANTKSRVFYAKAYSEGDSGESARPDCYSSDGVAPAADARNPQAKKCQLCPHAVWGSKPGMEGKGTACSVNTRLAVVDPESSELEPLLLRVPAGSRSNFADVVKTAQSRGIPYNALVLKVGFDKEAPSPKLTFKLIGLLDDATYEKVNALYTSETVLEIVDLQPKAPEAGAPALTGTVTEEDLDAALAAKVAKEEEAKAKADEADEAAEKEAAAKAKKAAAAKAKAEKEAADAAKAEKEAADAAKAKAAADAVVQKAATSKPDPEPTAVTGMEELLDGLDALLDSTDD